jgi:uncharacterized protein (TIGR00251 family)
MGNIMDNKTTLEIHLQPGAKRNEVAGFRDGVLYVKVTALPQKGQANRALLELMAQTLGVPKSALAVIRGYTNRNKVVGIQGLTAEELKDILARNSTCKDFLNLLK